MTAPTASRSRSGGDPAAYLDPAVRAGISIFHLLDATHVESAMERLADDLASGAWAERNSDLLELDELDLGLRLVVWEKTSPR